MLQIETCATEMLFFFVFLARSMVLLSVVRMGKTLQLKLGKKKLSMGMGGREEDFSNVDCIFLYQG